MPRFPRLQAGFLLFLLWESACHSRRAVPLPSPPASYQPASPAAASGAASSQPSNRSNPPAPARPQQQNTYQVNKPPQPTPSAKKPTRSAAAPAPAPPEPTPVTIPPAPEAPPPVLGDVLTADEQKQYNTAIDQSLSRAQVSLSSIGGRQLTKDQQAELEQVRSFMQQARATRGSDLAGAKSLSERAEVLARDLAASLH